MEYTDTKLFAPILAVMGFLLTMVGRRIAKSFENLVHSVDKLNINIAVIIERVNSHEKRIKELERRK